MENVMPQRVHILHIPYSRMEAYVIPDTLHDIAIGYITWNNIYIRFQNSSRKYIEYVWKVVNLIFQVESEPGSYWFSSFPNKLYFLKKSNQNFDEELRSI